MSFMATCQTLQDKVTQLASRPASAPGHLERGILEIAGEIVENAKFEPRVVGSVADDGTVIPADGVAKAQVKSS
jgi:hypothetical protein